METITISLASARFFFLMLSYITSSPRCQTKDNLKHCEHWINLSNESLTDTTESKETEGTQDGSRTNSECGTYNHTGTHRCPYVSDRSNAIASSTLLEVWKKETVSVKCVLSVFFTHAYMWSVHRVAFMSTLCLPGLLIIIKTWGPEETLLKIKRSGDV